MLDVLVADHKLQNNTNMDSITDSNRVCDSSRGRISTLISDILSALAGITDMTTMSTTQVNQVQTGQQTEEIISQSMVQLLTTASGRIQRPVVRITPYDLYGARYGLIQIGQALGEREQLDMALMPVTNMLADYVDNVCTYFATHVRQNTSSSPLSSIEPFRARQYFVEQFSWAVPSLEALEKIKEYAGDGKVLEIFAGSGLWTLLLRLMAVRVVSTDSVPKVDGFAFVQAQTATEAVQSEQDANLLFMCWAPYADPADYDALVEFHGEYVVTVSEGQYGCVGSDQFWEYLFDHYESIDHAEVPNWYGIHDHLEVWRRRTSELEVARELSGSEYEANGLPSIGADRQASDDADDAGDDIVLQAMQALNLAVESGDLGVAFHRQPSEADEADEAEGYDSYSDYGCGDPWCSYCGNPPDTAEDDRDETDPTVRPRL